MGQLANLCKAIEAHLSFVVLDTETTGLDDGEICQIAIINHQGETLLDTLVKTVNPIPEQATAIHGITDDMVKDAPLWIDVRNQVIEIIDAKLVLIYNAVYDRRMLHCSDRASRIAHFDYQVNSHFECVMQAYAEYNGHWNDYYQSYRWYPLSHAAQHFLFSPKQAHTALADCITTLAVINGLLRVE